MADKYKTGGRAFPAPSGQFLQGMSLHEYYAAHAPEPPVDWFDGDYKDMRDVVHRCAEWAYAYADEMINIWEARRHEE